MQPLGCQVNKAGTGNTRKVTRQNMQIFYQPTHFFLGLFEAGIHVYEAIVVGVPRTVSVSETRYRLHPCKCGMFAFSLQEKRHSSLREKLVLDGEARPMAGQNHYGIVAAAYAA